MKGVAFSFWAALSTLSVLGLRYPVKMLSLLGDMLMEVKRPAEALEEYEASQEREPNRYRGLYGAGQAAAQSGNRDKARHYFSKLLEFAGSGDLR